MNEMREIVDLATVNRALLALAIAGPVLGAAVGLAMKRPRGFERGLAIGLLGTLAWGMWHVYGAITARYGLDSVKNLGINALVFVVVGALVGWGLGAWWRRGGIDEESRAGTARDIGQEAPAPTMKETNDADSVL
jgi:hypothetical protein